MPKKIINKINFFIDYAFERPLYTSLVKNTNIGGTSDIFYEIHLDHNIYKNKNKGTLIGRARYINRVHANKSDATTLDGHFSAIYEFTLNKINFFIKIEGKINQFLEPHQPLLTPDVFPRLRTSKISYLVIPTLFIDGIKNVANWTAEFDNVNGYKLMTDPPLKT